MAKTKNGGNPGKELQYIKTEIDNHNAEIKGEFGLTGLATVVLQKRKNNNANIILKFSYPVTREGLQKPTQYSLGNFGSAYSIVCRKKAYEASLRLTRALKFNQFSKNPIEFWEWLDYDVIGKHKSGNDVFIIGDLIDSYKAYWIKCNRDKKEPEIRYFNLRGQYLDKLPCNNELTGKVIEDYLMSLPDNNTLKKTITAIKYWLSYHRLYDTYQSHVNCRNVTGSDTEERSTYTPNDEQIIKVYENGFSLLQRNGKKKRKDCVKATQAYQFIYGIMATYGIRAHEFFYVLNWHNPVDISSGEWVTVDSDNNDATDEEYGSDTIRFDDNRVVPAFFDPANEHPILVIGDDTKTGKRLAVPLSPKGDDWIKRFNLKDGLKMPDISDPTAYRRKSERHGSRCIVRMLGTGKRSIIDWDLTKVPSFTSHKLRHAFTHRGRVLGFDPWKLAQAQGHTLGTAEAHYAKNLQGQRTKAMLTDELKRVEQQSKPVLTYDEAIMRMSTIKAKTDNLDDALMMFASEIYGMKVPNQESVRSHE